MTRIQLQCAAFVAASVGAALAAEPVRAGDPYQIADVWGGSGSSDPLFVAYENGTMLFTARSEASGRELWKTDGTAAGTVQVRDLMPGRQGSWPENFIHAGGVLFFTATREGPGAELYRIDGSTISRVKTLNWTQQFRGPHSLVSVGSTLFFALGTEGGDELWKSDGTDAGTVRVKDISTGPTYPQLLSLTNVGGTLYFIGREFTFNGDEWTSAARLWRSDGTTFGTTPLTPQGDFGRLTNLDGTTYFTRTVAAHAVELWTSDGTVSGTTPLTPQGDFGEITSVNGTVYFTTSDTGHGIELWKSDGTVAGTVLLKDVAPGPASSAPSALTAFGGSLFFAADDSVHGRELWKSDGTEGGTVLVNDVAFGPVSSSPGGFIDVGGTLFFTADDGTHGVELWKSDGTDAGTVLINDIAAGTGSSTPSLLVGVGGKLYFAADDGAHGVELRRSNGTTNGTVRVGDIAPGIASSSPARFTRLGDVLLFSANDHATGVELWGLDLTLEITIDVKPGGNQSPINLKAKGKVPVALMGAADLDVNDIDVATVRLAGAAPVLQRNSVWQMSVEDVDGDGHDDLVLHFETQNLDLRAGDDQATLRARLLDGTDLVGVGAVTVTR